MTGFGRAVKNFELKKITFEVKSLNSKQIDIMLKFPNSYKEKEMEMRNILIDNVIRGKVDAALTIEDATAKGKTEINVDLLENYYLQMKKCVEKIGFEEPKDWLSVLTAIPDIFLAETPQINENEWIIVVQSIEEALLELKSFRIREGKILEEFFIEKIKNIDNLLIQIPKYEDERLEKIKNKMYENFNLIENKAAFDQNRFEQELIFYIEKFDISEEKLRLKAHLDYFLQTIENEEKQGKKLGFIVQEIGREINTLGSKSNHHEMQKIVVMMKDELEQIKEQILNIL
jgi:uncharacterized protein (TIGR00255 family)